MIKVVSLFSGGGGLDLGFIWEDYKIIWAIDIDKNAVETYSKNIGSHIIHEDITTIDIKKIPKADIVIGGPPCQAFSLIGKRDVNDIRANLVWKYLEVIKHVSPKAFVFENVQGLLSSVNKEGNKVLDELIEQFKNMGYTLNYQVMNAADYGVPQRRKRLIIVGLKGEKKYEFPEKIYVDDETQNNKYISVREALDDLEEANFSGNVGYKDVKMSEYQKLMRSKSEKTTDHTIPTMSELDKFIVANVKPGGNYMDIPDNVASERIKRLKKEGGRTTCYGRLNPQKPAYTINTYFNRPNVGCNIHYKYNRLITVREALRLQSFPDDYQLYSSSKSGKNTIVGNAVPPLLAMHIAKKLKLYIKKKIEV